MTFPARNNFVAYKGADFNFAFTFTNGGTAFSVGSVLSGVELYIYPHAKESNKLLTLNYASGLYISGTGTISGVLSSAQITALPNTTMYYKLTANTLSEKQVLASGSVIVKNSPEQAEVFGTKTISITLPAGAVLAADTFPETINCIAFGDGKFVAGGTSLSAVNDNGAVITSTDGENWSGGELGSSFNGFNIADIIYVPEIQKWIACGAATGSNKLGIALSDNGSDWSTAGASSVTNAFWARVRYLNGYTVAVGTSQPDNNRIFYNDKLTLAGADWEFGDYTANPVQGMDVSDSLFMIATENGDILTSPTGETWTDVSPSFNTDNDYRGVAYANGRWVVVSRNFSNKIIYSDDNGSTWTAITAYDRFVFHDVTYQAGSFYFLCVEPSGLDTILSSKDLVTFGKVTNDIITGGFSGNEVTRLAIGNGKLIAIDPATVNYLLG